MKLLTVGVRFGGMVQLRKNLKPFGSPTLALSLSASYYLDTFSRWVAATWNAWSASSSGRTALVDSSGSGLGARAGDIKCWKTDLFNPP